MILQLADPVLEVRYTMALLPLVETPRIRTALPKDARARFVEAATTTRKGEPLFEGRLGLSLFYTESEAWWRNIVWVDPDAPDPLSVLLHEAYHTVRTLVTVMPHLELSEEFQARYLEWLVGATRKGWGWA